MLENLINLVKGPIANIITENSEIPEDKKEQSVKTAASSFVDGLGEHALQNPAALESLLTGSGSGAGMGGFTQKIEQTIASALSSKVGLQPALANQIATAIVPAVMSFLSKNVGSKGVGLGSETEGLGGELMGMVGSLFGKR